MPKLSIPNKKFKKLDIIKKMRFIQCMNLAEKKEIIVGCYQATYDLELAYLKAAVTEPERATLDADRQFQQRLLYFWIQRKEETVRNLEKFMKSANEQISFKATIEMGKYIYPEFFIDRLQRDGAIPPDGKDVVETFGELYEKAVDKKS